MSGFRLKGAGAVLAALAAITLGSDGFVTALAAAPAPKPVTPEQIADAKAQVAAAGLTCDVGTVRYIGDVNMKTPKGQVAAKTYEVSCAGRFGFIVQGPKGGSPDTQSYSCAGLKASADPKKKEGGGAQCELPENLDLKPAAQALAAKAGATCTVSNVKWRGISKAGTEFYELACGANQPGFMLSVPKAAGDLVAQNCLQLNGVKCDLTTDAQSTAWVAAVAGKGGRSCQATKSRFVGQSKADSTEYYELGCAQGAGFMVAMTPQGEYKRTIECADASNLAGGCTLTDQATIQAGANQAYGDRLKGTGLACAVTKARMVGQTHKKEDVIEFACSDRPAGLLVAFPNTAGEKPDVVDCMNARHFGTQCEFTPRQAQLDLLTKAMTAAGKTCTVSDFSNLGSTEKGAQVMEVACGASNGYIAEFGADYAKAKNIDTCAEAAKTSAKTGLSCSLPGNH